MKAKMLLVACLVSLMSASMVMAQGKGRSEHAGKGGQGSRMDGILSQLNLDEKQQGEVSKLREQMRTEMQSAKGNKEAMHQAMTNFRTKVMEILTPEQKQKFEQLMSKGGAHHGEGKGPGAGAGGEGGTK